MTRYFAILVVCIAAISLAPTAQAGSLGDFKDSYEETDSANSDDDDGDDSDDDSVSGDVVEGVLDALTTGGDHHSSCASCVTEEDDDGGINYALLVGHLPGSRFSLGRAPYAGRGHHVPSSLEELDGSALAGGGNSGYGSVGRFDGEVDNRHFQVTLRASGLTSSRFDAAGGEIFGKMTSTYMPGFSFSYQYATELRSEETLGVGYFAYEPSLLLARHVTISWNVGMVTLGDQRSLDETGATVGGALEVFPRDPLFLELRTNFHGFENLGMVDARLGFGAFVSDQIALEANVRHLNIIQGSSLTTYGVGLRSYLGF